MSTGPHAPANSAAPIITPAPGAFLSERQAQRLECLRAVLWLVSGRSVGIDTVERLTHWLYRGEE